MDVITRKLERAYQQDPTNGQTRVSLAQQYTRSGAFQIESIACQLPYRGMYEGGFFSCFQALQLIYHALQRAQRLNSECFEYSRITIGEWFEHTRNLLLDETEPNDTRKDKFEISLRDLGCVMWSQQLGYVSGNPWRDAEAILEGWDQDFHWVVGQIRNARNGITWRTDESRDIPGSSKLEISFDWPRWYYRLGLRETWHPEERYGELPSCSIIYENPTPEMTQLLCGLSTKFWTHRELPEVPALEQREIAPLYDRWGDAIDRIPLHIRGELVMPNCEQMRLSYEQQYGPSDTNRWMFNGIGANPVCVRCPTCNNVYSAYKDGGDDPSCFCQVCQYTLIEGYHGSNAHLLTFARQHATVQANMGFHDTYPVWIPNDCPENIRQQMLAFYAEKYPVD